MAWTPDAQNPATPPSVDIFVAAVAPACEGQPWRYGASFHSRDAWRTISGSTLPSTDEDPLAETLAAGVEAALACLTKPCTVYLHTHHQALMKTLGRTLGERVGPHTVAWRWVPPSPKPFLGQAQAEKAALEPCPG